MEYASKVFRFYIGKGSHGCVIAFGILFLSFVFYYGHFGLGDLFSIKTGFNWRGITIIKIDILTASLGFDIKFGYRGI